MDSQKKLNDENLLLSEKEDEEITDFPTIKTISKQSQVILDFAQSWNAPLEYCIIMVLRQVSPTRAKYIQKHHPKLFEKYTSYFFFTMGTKTFPPPPPQPVNWLDECMKTKIPFEGWRPADWFERVKHQKLWHWGFRPIKDCMPPLSKVCQMNKDFLEGKKADMFYRK